MQFFHSLLLLSLTRLYSLVLGENSENCYANNTDPYLLFGTKSAYKLLYSNRTLSVTPPGCTPVLLWSIVRHGTRNPFFNELVSLNQLKKLRDQIMDNEESFKNVDMCLEDLNNLKSWTFKIDSNESSLLAQQGQDEMYTLGQRFQKRFAQIFHRGYKAKKFVFQTTDSIRSNQSAMAFLQGLFLLNNTENMTSVNNNLLKSYKNCTMWKFRFGTNREIASVMTHFSKMKLVTELVQNVSTRLGFFFTLEPREISIMYQMCRYDRAFNQSSTYISPWCAVFTKEQLKILEFKEDLFYYYKHGYGMNMNIKLGCPLLQDIIIKMNEAVNHTDQARSTVYFTSHGMFERLLTRLGIFNDSNPLTGKNVTNTKRKWRTSNIPFGANLVIALYRCQKTYKVIFYLNEEVLLLDGCGGEICEWETIKDMFTNITDVNTCNLNDCYVGSGTAFSRQTTFYIYAVLFVVISLVFFSAS